MGCCQTSGPKGNERVVDGLQETTTTTKACCCTCDDHCERMLPPQFAARHHSDDPHERSSSSTRSDSSNSSRSRDDDAGCVVVASEGGERGPRAHRPGCPAAKEDPLKVVVGLPAVGPQATFAPYAGFNATTPPIRQTAGKTAFGSLDHISLSLANRPSPTSAPRAPPTLPGTAYRTPETSPLTDRRNLRTQSPGFGQHGQQYRHVQPFREAAGSFSSISATGEAETPAASAVVPIGLPVHSAGASLSQCPSMQIQKVPHEMTVLASSESDPHPSGPPSARTQRTLSAESGRGTRVGRAGEAPPTVATMMARRSSGTSSSSASQARSQKSQTSQKSQKSQSSSELPESRSSSKQTLDPASLVAPATTATTTAAGEAMTMRPSSSKGSQKSQRSDTVPPAVGRRRSSSSQLGSSMSSLPSANLRAVLSRSGSILGSGLGAPGGQGESWTDFVTRTKSQTATADVGTSAVENFEVFRTSEELGKIFSSFARLFELSSQGTDGSISPWELGHETYPYERFRVLLGGHWKAKKLWEKLDKRSRRPDFQEAPCAGGRICGRRVVVVGAGPCGLYSAIALRLLGATVTVVERRVEFSRINQLHVWPWCGEEIKDLGARCLEPPPQDFGANPDLLSIGISDLQTMLLKTCLLLGVEIFLGVDYKHVAFDQSLGWHVQLAQASGSSHARPSPQAPPVLPDVAAVISADGGCGVPQTVGVQMAELGSLRAEDAIGIVCNFTVQNTPSSRNLRSFALASQFYGPLFKRVAAATGAELENIVFTKSKGSYYFVMTPTRRCLVQSGVLRDAGRRPLLEKENVDRAALEALCRRVVSFPFKEGEPTVQQVGREAVAAGAPGAEVEGLTWADRGPQLFDFSKLRRASDGVVFLPAPAGSGAEALPFLLAGDTLLEPFWPEGLGIVRGFLSSLDACWALSLWSSGAEASEVREQHGLAFAQLKTLMARTRRSVLKSDESNYALDPTTRYRTLGNAGSSPTHAS